MVDVQDAKIVDSTRGTFPAEFSNQCQLALPYSLPFVDLVAVLIPKCLAAFWAAITNLAGLSAVDALSVFVPAIGKVARLATELPGPIANAVSVHFDRLTAMLTNDCDRLFSHACIVSKYAGNCEPKYFEIAVKRIKAELNAAPLFEPKPVIKQGALFGNV